MKFVRRFETNSAEETHQAGRQLAQLLPEHGVVLLVGELGAGKTTLTKGIVEGRGAARAEDVSSPTFTLIHEYGDPVRIYHVDLYRLDTLEQARRLGLEDLFEQPALTLVEWGDRFPSCIQLRPFRLFWNAARAIGAVSFFPIRGSCGSGYDFKRMSAAKVASTEFQSLTDLKPLLSSPGPCVSVYMKLASTPPNQSAKTNALEWKETLRAIEPKLEELGAGGRELLGALSDWENISKGQEREGEGVAVFRSPESSHVVWLQAPVASRAVVGPHFFIRPLLPELTRAQNFYILALSQKNVRLLRCTSSTSEEVAIPEGTPTSFEAYMNTEKPDHVRNNLGSAGPSAGHTKGIVQSTGTEREDKVEYLGHFFRQIDRGVNELLRGSSDPVVLAAVEYELAQYRSTNTYPHLLDEDVQGAPNSLKSGEMHARAIEALKRSVENRVDQILAEYNHKAGGGASNRLKDIVTAAHDGRVLTLLVSDSLETTGVFDEATHSVSARKSGTAEDEDLVNDAAVQTVVHAGRVLSVPNGKMPNGSPLAAIFRY